jgi:hypothetical protein
MSLRRPSNSRIRLHPTFDSYLKDKRAKQTNQPQYTRAARYLC